MDISTQPPMVGQFNSRLLVLATTPTDIANADAKVEFGFWNDRQGRHHVNGDFCVFVSILEDRSKEPAGSATSEEMARAIAVFVTGIYIPIERQRDFTLERVQVVTFLEPTGVWTGEHKQ